MSYSTFDALHLAWLWLNEEKSRSWGKVTVTWSVDTLKLGKIKRQNTTLMSIHPSPANRISLFTNQVSVDWSKEIN